jgi:hypothetical protein
MFRPRFEHSTSRISVKSITITSTSPLGMSIQNSTIIVAIVIIIAITIGNQASKDARRPLSTHFQRRPAYIPVSMCPEFTAVLIRFASHKTSATRCTTKWSPSRFQLFFSLWQPADRWKSSVKCFNRSMTRGGGGRSSTEVTLGNELFPTTTRAQQTHPLPLPP